MPYQTALGKPPVPDFSDHNSTADIEDKTNSQVVVDQRNSLHDAIVAFKKAQSSNRIRQAFRAKLKMSVGPFKRELVFVSNPGCLRRLFEPDIEAENLIQELNT